MFVGRVWGLFFVQIHTDFADLMDVRRSCTGVVLRMLFVVGRTYVFPVDVFLETGDGE